MSAEGPSDPAPPQPTDARAMWRALGPAAPLALAWSTLPALLGFVLLWRLGDAAAFFADDGGRIGWFVAVFTVAAGLGLLPTYAQTALAGWVFGVPHGLVAAWIGYTGAALVGYAVARVVAREHVVRLLEAYPKAAVVRSAFVDAGPGRAFGVVALLRLSPNSPFAMTNFALAASGVGAGPYVLGTALGIVPRVALVAGLAHLAAASGARDLGEFVTEGPGWLVLFAGIATLVLALAVLSHIGKRALARAGLTTAAPRA